MAAINVGRLVEESGAGLKTRRFMAIIAAVFTIAAFSHLILMGFANQAAASNNSSLYDALYNLMLVTPYIIVASMAAQVVLILWLAILILIRHVRSTK